MTDITERLRQYGDGLPAGLMLMRNAADEIDRLRGLIPELAPRPPQGDGLPRYGLRWNGPTEPLSVPMTDGYWTPWHLADRLRARVAELESARGEPVAWMNPYGGTLQVRITGLEYEKYTIPLYTAPPAQAVDVDAISDEAIEQGCEAMWAHSYRIADPGSMRAALRAIFNKGE